MDLIAVVVVASDLLDEAGLSVLEQRRTDASRETRPDLKMVSIRPGRTNETAQAFVAVLRRANNDTYTKDTFCMDAIAPIPYDISA